MTFPLPAFNPFWMPAAASFVGVTHDPGNLASYTFTGVSLGSETQNKSIVVVVYSNATPTGVTIGGVAATVGQTGSTSIWYLHDVAATSANVVVTFSGARTFCSIAVYQVLYLQNKGAPYVTATSTSDPSSLNSNVVANSVGIGGARYLLAAGSAAWTGLTEQFDEAADASINAYISGAVANFSAAESPRTISADYAGSGASFSAAFAAWS